MHSVYRVYIHFHRSYTRTVVHIQWPSHISESECMLFAAVIMCTQNRFASEYVAGNHHLHWYFFTPGISARCQYMYVYVFGEFVNAIVHGIRNAI